MAYTPDEVWVEYLEDIYERNPAALRDLDITDEGGAIQIGDAEADEIERRLAEGEDPEEVFAKWGNKAPQLGEGLVESEDIEDDYCESSDDVPTDDLPTLRPTRWTPTKP